jgi:SPOR domain
VRRVLGQCVESASAFMKRQDWRVLTRIRTEPATAFVVSVLLGGVIAVAVYGRGKSDAGSPQAAYVADTSQSYSRPNTTAQGSVSALGQSQSPITSGAITSQDVDLRRNSSVDLGNKPSLTPISLNESLGSEPATPSMQTSQVTRAAKRKQTPARTVERKTPSNAQAQAPSLALTNSVQPLTLLSAETSQVPTPETAAPLPQPAIAPPDPALDRANPTNPQKAADSGPKSPTLFVEVGSFKDETWANSAVEKLTQLGFHAVLIHKTLLWTQSFHVQVGPYADAKDIDAARQSLASHGFKSHPVN